MDDTHPQVSIDTWTQRPARQMLLEGRVELYFGLILLISSLPNLYMTTRPHVPDPPWYWMLIPLLGVVGFLGLIKGMKWLNERLIAPRSGYVAFQERPMQRCRIMAIFLGIGAVTAVLSLLRIMPRLDWMGLGLAIVLAAFFFVVGIQFKLPHWLLLGGFALAVAAWLFRKGVGMESAMWVSI